MRVCDLTLAYTEVSGGIRTYIDQKRRYLLARTPHEHILIVPGERDEVVRDERTTTVKIASPICPGCEPYRMFLRPDRVLAALNETRPDVVELASFFLAPWAAFQYRSAAARHGRDVLVGGYFHTDLAEAYVGAPLRGVVGAAAGDWAARRAAAWFGRTFRRCDRLFAATAAQADRLRTYGVTGRIDIVPLGVDTGRFHPRWRSTATRHEWGADGDALVLIYGGRLDREKHVDLLISAFERLPEGKFRLVICGEGADRPALEAHAAAVPGVRVLPYQRDKRTFARMLASADVYVTAGPHETFGLSVIEALASGLPVVGVESGAIVERVTADTGRLGPVDDAEAFAANILAVAARRDAMSQAARAAVVEGHYGWADAFAGLLEGYGGNPPKVE